MLFLQSMISVTLKDQDFLDTSDEDIQFAKGAYEFPLSFKELREKNKRREEKVVDKARHV